ncbi:FAD/NAD(P)-binding domain-containing protein [Mytilinidion resinicola]|uniref:FAD/NAD(P)-binding domain-containing protein n=1 Tax=Mytilinidion resinicola TaxID=574789 RepID=A0A6A6YC77_9PEZI|nr:FAD/NAD(P)-binding domain-containing protein [Mytilinidion resinicola]KAF2805447.1 FAD/NAD(P)-binding domain-containing protein [Mytilinidion resinicola]
MKHIVIVGGSYGGVSTSHRLLKQAGKSGSIKITLVSPNTHFYWNMAAPRGVIPGQFDDDTLFRPIANGFKHYPAGSFEFIVGSADSLDAEAKKLLISTPSGKQAIGYDFLILATGSHTKGGAPFKELGSTEETKRVLHDFQARVKKARTVVVAGAGVTGCEVAGELACEYGMAKKVTLIASGSTVLPDPVTPAFIPEFVDKELRKLNIDIKLETKITGSAETADGRTEVTLSTGDKLVTDLYIPTFGLVYNTSYLPAKFVNPNGSAMVDDYLKIKGAGEVWAIGDMCDLDGSQFLSMERHSIYVTKNIGLIMKGKPPLPYKRITSRIMGLQIGKKEAVGHYGSWRLPRFMMMYARKQLFLNRFAGTIDGSEF